MFMFKLALSARSDFAVAIAAVDWPAVGRLKRHLGLFAALGACHREHLAWESVVAATVSVPLRLPCLPARGTSLGLIGIAPGLKQLLLVGAEGEVSPTIGALDGLVLKTHWVTSSLLDFS
jgi:hypothetical protein